MAILHHGAQTPSRHASYPDFLQSVYPECQAKMEPQCIDESLLDELRAHPFEMRAIFLSESSFRDHVIYVYADAAGAFHAVADVDEEQEEQVIQSLLDLQATVTQNKVSFPRYESRHTLHPGKRFTVALDQGELHYVPHRSVGTQHGQEWEHEAQLHITTFEADQLKKDLMADREDWFRTLEDFVLLVRRDERTGKRLTRLELLPLLTPADRTTLSKALAEGKYWKGWWPIRPRRKDIEAEGWERVQGNEYLSSWSVASYKEEIKAINQLVRSSPLTVRWKSDQPDFDMERPGDWEQVSRELQKKFNGYANDLRTDFWNENLLRSSLQHTSQTVVGRKTIPHEAPFSERGVIRCENIDPIALADTLHTLDLAQDVCPEVPYKAIYSHHRRGRILPVHEDYARGYARPPALRDTMVMHGITGTRGSKEAVERLETILRAGGLKSIAERRRMNIGVNSMSPMGDIASGIDTGVPATISNDPTYGGEIYFGLNPSVLTRRDIWFSDRDFGSSHHRYEAYTAYAEKIGQGKIFSSPSPRSRERHVRSAVKRYDNEVYLKHEVKLEEIDTVFVEERLLSSATTLIRQLQREGAIPKDIRVENFDYHSEDSLPNKIKQRARDLL